MLAPRHLVVEANGKQCEVKQEEEFHDDGIKMGLSCIAHDTAKRCAIPGMPRFGLLNSNHDVAVVVFVWHVHFFFFVFSIYLLKHVSASFVCFLPFFLSDDVFSMCSS